MFHNARVCLVVYTPFAKVTGPGGRLVYDPISPLWHKARAGLHFPTNFNTVEPCVDGLEVGDARSRVAAMCLGMDPPPEFVFSIDSDVIVPHDALTKLFFRARCYPDHDVFAGVYCLKSDSVPDPLIYTENGQGPYWDWAVGDILTTDQHKIGAVHMGLTLIRVGLFQRLKDAGLVHGDGTDQSDEPFFQTVNTKTDGDGVSRLQMGTEDISFCAKARKVGAKILVDTSVLAGHHDKRTGVSYGLPWEDGPWKRGKWLTNPGGKRTDEEECKEQNLKLAIDLGAGSTRREWKGYKTYTLDARKESGADYIQDLRWLNLCDNHYDLVASSHSLEHIGRWDQERVWSEIFRICKPGGKIEHVVPSWEWAAHKIVGGEMDEHVTNVLVGAQESHGYERMFNTHFMPYTKAVATALAAQAGFVDIVVQDWRDEPSLGYNMIITGKKPEDTGDAGTAELDTERERVASHQLPEGQPAGGSDAAKPDESGRDDQSQRDGVVTAAG